MTATERPLSVRSAVSTLRQGLEELEAALPAVAPGRARLLNYWRDHLRADLKTLELLAMAEDDGR